MVRKNRPKIFTGRGTYFRYKFPTAENIRLFRA
jgi:hypothetical protein